MIRRAALSLAVAAVLGAGAASAAPPVRKGPVATPSVAGVDPDFRCMLVASALSQNTDPKARSMSGVMVFYYLGRIDARKPGLDLKAALANEARSLVPSQLQADGKRCIDTLNSRARMLQARSSGPAPAAVSAAPSPPAAAPPAK